jgi:hypothetical protein
VPDFPATISMMLQQQLDYNNPSPDFAAKDLGNACPRYVWQRCNLSPISGVNFKGDLYRNK